MGILLDADKSEVQISEDDTHDTPTSGSAIIYAKTDGLVYSKDDAGNEYNLTNSATPTISSGSGAPSSTPGKIGDLYIDTVAPALYAAKGAASSADWFAV